MTTPNIPSVGEQLIDSHSALGGQTGALVPERLNPDNPPWSLLEAIGVWIASVALLIFAPIVTTLPYVLYRMAVLRSPEAFQADSSFIFFSVLGVFPAHVLTLGLIWFVVSDRGRRPFWQTVGWKWPANFGPWRSSGLAIALLACGWVITKTLGGSDTQLDQLINSSTKARLAIAFLAVSTTPLVEEFIYRGILYSALQRAVGVLFAVVTVSLLFASVHILQYYNNLGVIAVITILSIALTLVRARTKQLLPAYVMHLVFNGVQSLVLLLQPVLEKFMPEVQRAAGLFLASILSLYQR